ncbi:MAG: N-acetylmuramoyl-L-alanine amidase [Spirochaetaceae bacterium]|nr:N-acetylmuramoyl-L-alanine amidase [Spirochaetaceae bacterium]
MLHRRKTILKTIILIFMLILTSTSLFAINPFDYPVKTIFIDPGHGGKDVGASRTWDFAGGVVNEKDITLKIANKVSTILQKEHSGINVYQTRLEDEYLSLQERSEICYLTLIEPKSSVIYISIHVNAVENIIPNGFEIFTKEKNDKKILFDQNTPIENIPFFSTESSSSLNSDINVKSFELATNVEQSLSTTFPLATNRGIKQADLYVLNVSRAPSILIEVGFLSNEDDARNLLNDTYLHKMASSIARGISSSL